MKEEKKMSSTKEYWQKNIEAFGKFYDQTSEENIIASPILVPLYRKIIFPLEKKVTLGRYTKTVDFIDKNVKPGMIAVDLGCGTGVFTVELLLKGAKVLAVDYVEQALSLTEKRVKEMMPQLADRVDYLLLDIMEKPLPKSDIVIAIGVTPYVNTEGIFLDHILPTTNEFYCLFLNKWHWANLLRNYIKFLNVRKYYFFDDKILEMALLKYNFRRISREICGTGFLDTMKRIEP
ncbi:MAG: hypothetical protein C3F06_07865 [Candidatus Methanoperedenaceae archaeon]|nr:MAG: hypothetical protein C3F06_07865 [Candidatus Methanoperedenaceae archaeon]